MTNITAQKREILGKQVSQLRNDGLMPGVVYNSKGDSEAITLNTGELIRLVKNSTTASIIDLELDGKTTKVLIKDVDFDPVKDEIRHIAFFAVDEKQAMVFEIPVVVKGVSPAVKNNLGVLVQPNQVIEVKAKLADLVPEIVIDISGLDQPGMSITVADVALPEGIELLHKENTDVALVSISQLQKTLKEEADEAIADAPEGEEVDEETTEGETAEAEATEE